MRLCVQHRRTLNLAAFFCSCFFNYENPPSTLTGCDVRADSEEGEEERRLAA